MVKTHRMPPIFENQIMPDLTELAGYDERNMLIIVMIQATIKIYDPSHTLLVAVFMISYQTKTRNLAFILNTVHYINLLLIRSPIESC
jgi:hypothetical protein